MTTEAVDLDETADEFRDADLETVDSEIFRLLATTHPTPAPAA
jgi:hypothetical protein